MASNISNYFPNGRGVIAVLVGLPGAGKTTLCKLLTEQIANKNTHNSMPTKLHPIHLCYDQLMPDPSWPGLVSGEAGSRHTNEDQPGRSGVRNGDKCDDGGEPLGEGPGQSNLNSSKKGKELAWKAKRRLIVADVRDWLAGGSSGSGAGGNGGAMNDPDGSDRNVLTCLGQTVDMAHEAGSPFVLLVDDNMHYRNMRYPYYQVARDYGLGYCSIYCCCDKASAIAHNRSRSLRVPDSVIDNMTLKLEPPLPEDFPWEKCTMTVESRDVYTSWTMESITDVLLKSLSNPIPPPVIQRTDAEKCLDKTANLDSIIHQADLCLRKLVSETIKHQTNDRKQQIAQLLKKLKTDILSGIKSGDILVNLDSINSEVMQYFERNIESIA